ncbi:MAG: hypothetical protein ACJAZP_000224 [Psychromonas sp.]|jgi:hypothetical protein|uniref:hypothetical protein n=1 Tax=Psychromonas sp. TaxID=1884585 RepID=UPI0039E2504A
MTAGIVLLRGIFRGKQHWVHFTEKLQAVFSHKKINAVDISSCGELSCELSLCSIEAMVNSLRSLLSAHTKSILQRFYWVA